MSDAFLCNVLPCGGPSFGSRCVAEGESCCRPLEVSELLARWWFNYDQGNFEVLDELLSSDVHFVVATDTGTTDYEEFVRSDLHGHDEVLAWQVQHRLDSPYPLRHMGVNVHVTGT